MNELRMVVPGLPPSAGHYNAYRVSGGRAGKAFVQCYPTPEAKSWWSLVAAVNAGRKIRGSSLELSYIVFFPDHRRRDVDNAAKQILDSLTRCGAIEDDSFVFDMHGHKRIDKLSPRTVILIKSNQESLL